MTLPVLNLDIEEPMNFDHYRRGNKVPRKYLKKNKHMNSQDLLAN